MTPVVELRSSTTPDRKWLAQWFAQNVPDDPVAWAALGELWPSDEDRTTRLVDLTVAVQQMLQPSRT